jgi:hypothetical protein
MAEFIDAALQYESSWERAEDSRERLGAELEFYGSSVGAIRGTVRNALLKFGRMSHDGVTSLASELWAAPVYERRVAAIVLLQAHVDLLVASDLTRLEGFARTAAPGALVEPLATDVIRPLFASLDGRDRSRAERVFARWEVEGPSVRLAARIAVE